MDIELSLLEISDETAANVRAVLWDKKLFPLTGGIHDEIIRRKQIEEDFEKNILGMGIVFMNEAGGLFVPPSRWVMVLSRGNEGEGSALAINFLDTDYKPFVPRHVAPLSRLKRIMAVYLEELQAIERGDSLEVIETKEYKRKFMHDIVSNKVMDAFRVPTVLPNAYTRYNSGDIGRQFFSTSGDGMERRRFFFGEPTASRCVFNFVEFALAAYDEPFRAELKRRAHIGGYDC